MGMPYGKLGALREHLANVSANELPELLTKFEEYLEKILRQIFLILVMQNNLIRIR
ncbi:hypothetical protein [Chryseobacterium indoltheticum]|uniref:hypothetical protein n=1 Tax=Chryseobacterium indoltheticum TaxID=254 RepID=UPI003F4919B6